MKFEISEIIALFGLIFGFSGMAIIILRKIPVLVELPQIPSKKPVLKPKISKKISFERVLEKALRKIRIQLLKLERILFLKIQQIKRNSEKERENIKYWEKIKRELKK